MQGARGRGPDWLLGVLLPRQMGVRLTGTLRATGTSVSECVMLLQSMEGEAREVPEEAGALLC